MSGRFEDLGEPVVRDRRRIDPETGELRQPAVDVTDIPAGDGTVPAGTVSSIWAGSSGSLGCAELVAIAAHTNTTAAM